MPSASRKDKAIRVVHLSTCAEKISSCKISACFKVRPGFTSAFGGHSFIYHPHNFPNRMFPVPTRSDAIFEWSNTFTNRHVARGVPMPSNDEDIPEAWTRRICCNLPDLGLRDVVGQNFSETSRTWHGMELYILWNVDENGCIDESDAQGHRVFSCLFRMARTSSTPWGLTWNMIWWWSSFVKPCEEW